MESRCTSTGSISVSVTGGSGSYSYKVTGPVTTPFTSSSNITGLQAGYYTIIVKDVTYNCTRSVDSVVVPGTYQDPRFLLTKVNSGCAANDGSIQMVNQQFGRSPFSYSIISPSPSNIGQTNTSGNFTGLTPGEYFIQLRDSCGGIQVRIVTIDAYIWWFDASGVTKIGCDSADAFINLRNNRGEVSSDPGFANYTYGVIITPGDTIWSNNNSFRFKIGNKRSVKLIARDNCGNFQTVVWNLPANIKPLVGSIAIDNFSCSFFRATVTGQQNLTSPQYCLLNAANTILQCNTTGVFNNIAYGSYCITTTDACYDTTINRCFISQKATPAVANTVNQTNKTCSTFTASITGQQNLILPYYCLYNASNVLIRCDSTGVFTNLSYGSYCITVKNGCADTIISRCFSATPPIPALGQNVSISNKTCSTFRATASGQLNLTNPQYCLYDSVNALVACNTTGIFSNLSYAAYCMKVTDGCIDTTITRCFTATPPVPNVSTLVSIASQGCSKFRAGITGQTNLTNPQYCLYDTSGNQIICNTTGVFDSLAYRAYCIRITDVCYDTTIIRCFDAIKPLPSLVSATMSGSNCTSFNVTASGTNLFSPQYCLYDSTGVLVTCNSTGIFNGLNHGRYCVKAITPCNDTTNTVCFTSAPPIGTVAASVQISNKICTGFTATITGQLNLTNPQYELYNAQGILVSTNSTGIFTNIPYGAYCIKTQDGCLNTTVVRCFSQARAIPTLNGTLSQTNSTCSTFTARATGSNLTNPQYCIYDNANKLVVCNATGIFDNLAYGRYCVTVTDGCVDTSITVCRTFTAVRDINLTTSKSCNIGFANVNVNFLSGFGPFTVNIYKPNGSLFSNLSSNSNPVTTELPALPAGQQYKIIGIDICAQKDTAFITPDASLITKSISRSNKCPSALWANGSGDLSVTASSNIYSVLPSIIKKNGAAFVMSHSFQSVNTFTFSDLEPATYIVKYTLQTCNTAVYDTISIDPYSYPTQGQSALYVCDNNSFSLSGNVRGGISPYTFAIIGSQPSNPSIISSPQNSPVFNINNGAIYSLIRLRTVDACGNATLADVSVLPLEYISITASQTCFYQDVSLSVPSIPNATYQWYKKTAPTDSVLLTTDSTYNLPFFLPEQVAEYICKINVNSGCLVRLASYTLNGNCGQVFLPLQTKLQGEIKQGRNQLTWNVTNDKDIYTYVIERRSAMAEKYYAIGNLAAKQSTGQSLYEFIDYNPLAESNTYRLRIVDKYSRSHFSNIVRLQKSSGQIAVYPNPVKNVLYISLSAEKPTDYGMELMDINGRLIDKTEYKNITQTIISYRRKLTIPKGMYLLRLTNRITNKIDTHRVSFE